MPDSSTSDHIGRLGELHFDRLVNKARLLSCRLDPDRIGRDRIVEFELEDGAGGGSFDTRPAPIGCSVQIKTVLSHTRRVRISLSNAMRLAGDPRPAFICVIRIDRRDEIVDMRFIHILGDNLSRILESLRRASQDKDAQLNKKSISFDIITSDIIVSTPETVRDYFAEKTGRSLETYATRKITQRNSLGYPGAGRFSFRFNLETNSIEEMHNFYLGLKDLRVFDFEAFEERFGITLPHKLAEEYMLSAGRVSVNPEPSGFADVTVRSKDAADEVAIRFDVISPPRLLMNGSYFKFILRSPMVEITVESGNARMSTTDRFRLDSTNDLDEWFSILRFLKLAFQKGSRLLVTNPEGHLLEIGLASTVPDDQNNNFISATFGLVERLRKLSRFSGIKVDPFCIRALIDSREDIDRVHSYIFNIEQLGNLSFETDDFIFEKSSYDHVLFVHRLEIVGSDIVSFLKCNMVLERVDGRVAFRSTSMHLLNVCHAPRDEIDFQFMIETRARGAEVMGVVVSDNRKHINDF